MKKMFKLVKGGKKEDKSGGSGTPSGDELDDDADGSAVRYCYRIDGETEDRMSRLHRAAWHGGLDKVKSLLSQKKAADVNAVDGFGRTPLHLAVAKGYYNIAWVLLNHGALLDYVDCDGYTPFLKAVECSQKECVHLMLERGADVTCTDTNKNSALHLAAKQGSFTIMSMLLKKGININAQNALGESVLHVACALENRDLIEFILDNGALINITDKQGRVPLMVIAKLGNMSIVDLLLERGSQLDACDVNGLSVMEYASREGHYKVVNQLSMQKMSMMARTRSQENVLDDLDSTDTDKVHDINNSLNNQKAADVQITEAKKEKNLTESYDNGNDQNNKQYTTLSSFTDNDQQKPSEKENVSPNFLVKNGNKLNVTNSNEKNLKNVNLDPKTVCSDNIILNKLEIENYQNEDQFTSANLITTSRMNNSPQEPSNIIDIDKELSEKKFMSLDLSTKTLTSKDEESVSQCTMPPPMDPPRSWDFIQTGIMCTADTNEKTEKKHTENIVQIPDPIVGKVNTDDSELEWGSDESLPTDPNQTASNVLNVFKKGNKNKKSTFYNFITTKLMSKNKSRVSASADNIIDGDTASKKHTRNKSFSSLGTFKLTVPSDLNKALHQLSPEMNFTHSSFGKSKSFHEYIPNESIDKNSIEFERSKSLCLELKRNNDTSENQQRDSDSQSDDSSSLRSKRNLLLSMRMPKVHDEHHDDHHLEVKECETSEDEGPHYWYSPNKKNDKIVQQDTVIRNNSDSENNDSEEIGFPKSKSAPEGISIEQKTSDESDSESTVSFSTSHEDINGTHKRTKYALKKTETLKAYLKKVTMDKDRLLQESAGYKEISDRLVYKLENLQKDISSQSENTIRLEDQLDLLDTKYTEALDKIQTLELSSSNLDKENQYLKEINKHLMVRMNHEHNVTSYNTSEPVEILTKLEMGDIGVHSNTKNSKTIITHLQNELEIERKKRLELDERVQTLAIEVSTHQSCGSTLESLKELQTKISKDYVPKKEILKLKTEQEMKISEVKMESEKKLADKFHDLDKLLSQQLDQQEKLEMQREKIENQLKQEFENIRQRFQLEIAKLQTTLKTKEMEEQILKERCEILSLEVEKTQDTKWKTLVDKSYGISSLQKSLPDMVLMHCRTPEPSPTFANTDIAESSTSKYQYNAQTLRNDLDKVIIQNKIAALEDDQLFDN